MFPPATIRRIPDMPRRTDGGAAAARGRGGVRRSRRPAFALGLMSVGVAAFVVLIPSVSDACQPSTTTASDRVERATAAGADVLIIGDSYTAGRGSSDAHTGWAQLLTASEAWRSTIDGRPGTGYANAGAGNQSRNTYLPRIAAHADLDPDLVLVQGSQNDWVTSADALQQRVEATLRTAERQWPDAVVVAIGPSAPLPRADTTAGIDAAVAAGAHTVGVPYIDPNAAGWFTTVNSPAYAARDGEHLDDDGYRYMARRVGAALRGLGTASSECQAS